MKVALTKITIISESTLKEKIVALIKRHGATGYTLTKVEGEGSRGVRASDWGGRNVMIEVIVSGEIADSVLEELSNAYFEDFAIIAWLTEVSVLRGEKFIPKK
ncbi:MAG: nitrogen regulatory protein P-II 2 [Verrucomicrobiales bacterium]|jgi:nitrogen regulatory protein P-II 2